MTKSPRPDLRQTGSGGGNAWTPVAGFLWFAAALLAAALTYSWKAGLFSAEGPPTTLDQPLAAMPGNGDMLEPAPDVVPRPASATTTGAAPRSLPPQPRIARHRDPGGDQTPDLSDFVNEGELPTMAEVITRLRQAGVTSGLAAFSPPGTRPPLIGLAVPEDFVLPPGYVRHYQATDDGLRIEPILMFSPDQAPLNSAGQPIAIPDNRVVPPEWAPPGLPIRQIVVPAPVDPSGLRR